MKGELSKYIRSVSDIRLDDSLSDDAAVALTNIHLSVLTLPAADTECGEYADASFHRGALERLFAICRKRSGANQTLARSSRMTPAMYNALSIPDTLFDGRKHRSCLKRSFRMADEWYDKTKGAGMTWDRGMRITEYGILQSLLDAFVHVVDRNKDAERDYLYLRRRMGDWASELDGGGGWSGISDYEAMRRLNIMLGNSNTNGDSRFDSHIERALRYYYDRIMCMESVDCRTLYYLYWAMMWGAGGPCTEKTDAIGDCARRMLDTPDALDRDKRLWFMAVCIDRECVSANRTTLPQPVTDCPKAAEQSR